MLTDSYQQIFSDKQRVMTVFAHPDDTEVFAGGLILRLTADGKLVRSIKMTNGNKGSRDNITSSSALQKERALEDSEAMHILGIKPEHNIHLNIDDGKVENTYEQIGMIAKHIRIFKPDIIITHNPNDIIIHHDSGACRINHRDHRHTAMNAFDASYPYSMDRLFFPEHFNNDNASPHRVTQLFTTDSYGHEDEVFISIDNVLDKKTEALKKHRSQFSEEHIETLINKLCKVKEHDGYWERFRYINIG